MTDILFEIVGRKWEVVARLRADSAAQDFRDRALAIRANATPHLLLRALESNSGGVKIIAEFKRRSPSGGTIRSDLSATDVATCYERSSRTQEELKSSRNLNAGRHRLERSAVICPRPTLPRVMSAVVPVLSRS